MDERDLDALVARLRSASNWLRQGFGQWKSLTSEYDRAPFEAADAIAALRARAEQAEADAERYRHIRSRFRIGTHGEWVAVESCGLLGAAQFDAKIDAAIDRARSQGGDDAADH